MACAPGARHFCDTYAVSTTQPTSKAIFTLPKLWPVRSDTAGKHFLVHAMLHPSLTCFFRMVDVLRPLPPVHELEQAIAILCDCLRMAALEKLGI